MICDIKRLYTLIILIVILGSNELYDQRISMSVDR